MIGNEVRRSLSETKQDVRRLSCEGGRGVLALLLRYPSPPPPSSFTSLPRPPKKRGGAHESKLKVLNICDQRITKKWKVLTQSTVWVVIERKTFISDLYELRTYKWREFEIFYGKGGIRTHGDRKATPIFKIGAINHSATFPKIENKDILCQIIWYVNILTHITKKIKSEKCELLSNPCVNMVSWWERSVSLFLWIFKESETPLCYLSHKEEKRKPPLCAVTPLSHWFAFSLVREGERKESHQRSRIGGRPKHLKGPWYKTLRVRNCSEVILEF